MPRASTEKVEFAVNTRPRFTGLPGLTSVVMPPGEVNARVSALASASNMTNMTAATPKEKRCVSFIDNENIKSYCRPKSSSPNFRLYWGTVVGLFQLPDYFLLSGNQ